MRKAKELLKINNINPKKKFGQNFLIDDNILKKISSLHNNSSSIIEIGAGTGALTQYLNKDDINFYIVEFDIDMINILKKEYPNIKIYHKDATKFDFSTITSLESERVTVFGNLPYNVSSRIIFNLIKNINKIDYCYFMLQKEVALRLIEKPNSKNYSRITVMTDLFFDKKISFNVKPNSFYPAPRVDSSIVEFKVKKNIENINRVLFAEIVKASFANRRKMLRNNLKRYIKYGIEEVIDLKKRAENLTFNEYVAITNIVDKKEIIDEKIS